MTSAATTASRTLSHVTITFVENGQSRTCAETSVEAAERHVRYLLTRSSVAAWSIATTPYYL